MTVSRTDNQLAQKLADAEPVIAFFTMSAALQVEILPSVEERKYDFPEGDLISKNAIEILLCIYLSMLNSISLELLVMSEDILDQRTKDIRGIVTLLCELAHLLFEEYFELLLDTNRLESIEWDTLRHLSFMLQQKAELRMTASRSALEECIESWVHS